ncbi:ABC transporter permease [Sphingomonas sp.]|jgi:ABC-2 type transport system permease protein|uniref:ABC transporter permease n=1 Tax=Sphingomonas sp. TaxID=28214 RepID=UPI002E151CBD|nr:ABC transporter permease [Sphingomonas sp.]HEV7288163.1 ABC transporter permease [Sphingomonas sp.]
MNGFTRLVRQTMTIARRDFVATVFTPTFLLFLLAPLMMLAFGTIGGLGAATMAKSGDSQSRIVILASGEQARSAIAMDKQMRRLFRASEQPAKLIVEAPSANPRAQAKAMFERKGVDTYAVLYGPFERPQILHVQNGPRSAEYLAELANQVLRANRAGTDAPLSEATKTVISRTTTSASGQGQAAFFTVFALFIVSLMLAGQVVGTMAEERSNKVIEILAAAVPLESVFFGKLLGMFGVAILFLLFWGTVVVNVGAFLPGRLAIAFSDIGPAVGTTAYVLLFLAYFVMAYLLLGAVFLGLGAQAATQRELQMMSLPITIFQVAMFGFASAAAASPDSWVATAAELFPFSSPFAMAARAANSPELWRHFAALAWQALWVIITVTIAARLFRRGVLQSGSPKLRRKKVVVA